jgi:hypothetical protein
MHGIVSESSGELQPSKRPPDRILVRPGQHRDRLTQFTVGRQPAVQVGINAQDVGQRHLPSDELFAIPATRTASVYVESSTAREN